MGSASAAQSFVEVAPESHFPIQNLPYGIFKHPQQGDLRVGVAIGAFVLDLAELEKREILGNLRAESPVFAQPALNHFMQLGRPSWSAVRNRITELLSIECPEIRDDQTLKAAVFAPPRKLRNAASCRSA